MNESDAYYEYTCTPCAGDGLNAEGKFYCIQCNKNFCDKCIQYHKTDFEDHDVKESTKLAFRVSGKVETALVVDSEEIDDLEEISDLEEKDIIDLASNPCESTTLQSNGPLEETAYNIPTFPLRDKLTNNNQAVPMFSEQSVTSEGSNPNTTNTTNKLCNVIKAKRISCITCVLLIIVIPGVLTFILALAKKM